MENNIIVNNCGSSSYILRLDALDLDTIRFKHFMRGNNTVNIWNNTPADLVEFEIYVSNENDASDDEDDYVVANTNTRPCHICNIDIPESYLKEHNNGAKHKANMTIVDTALERTKKHIGEIVDAPNTTPSSATYYCEPCSLAVKIKNRHRHEKTDAHNSNIERDRLLNDLLDIYLNKGKFALVATDLDPEPNIAVSNQDDNDTKEKQTIEDTHTGPNTAISNQDDNDIKEKQIIEDTDPEPNTAVSNQDDNNTKAKLTIDTDPVTELVVAIDSPKLSNLKSYIDLLNNQFELPKDTVSVVDETRLEITTLTGDRLVVPADHFHGYGTSKGKLQCRVCTMVMVADKKSHEMSEEHINLIVAPLKDKHCIRQIDDIYHHCILCNCVLTGDIEIHISNVKHGNLLQKALIVPIEVTEINKPEESKDYCDICHKSIGKVTKKTHRKSLNHRLQTCLSKTTRHCHMKKTGNVFEVICVVCNTTVPNDEDDINDHVKTYAHEFNYKSLMDLNKITKLGNYISMCGICSIRIIEMEEMHHITGAKHTEKLVKSLMLSETPENTFQNNQTQETKTVEDCNILDDNADEKLDQIVVADTSSIVVDETNNLINTHYLIETRQNWKTALCKACGIEILNAFEIITKHLESGDHLSSYSLLLKLNKVEVVNTFYGFYCHFCDVYLEIQTEIEHINHNHLLRVDGSLDEGKLALNNWVHKINIDIPNSSTTNKNVVNNGETKVKQNDDEIIHHEDLEYKNFDSSITGKSYKIHYLMEMRKFRLMCKICVEQIPNCVHNIKEHIKGCKHRSKYNKILLSQTIQEHSGGYFCETCNLVLPRGTEFDHFNNNEHITKLSNRPSGSGIVRPLFSNIITNKSNQDKEKKVEEKDREDLFVIKPSSSGVNSFGKLGVEPPSTQEKPKISVRQSKRKEEHQDSQSEAQNKEGAMKVKVKSTTVDSFTKFFKKLQDVKKTKANNKEGEPINDNNVMACDVCSVKFPKTTVNINEHYDGAQHKAKIALLMKTNIKLAHPKTYFCSICKSYFSTNSLVKHLFSDKHQLLSNNIE